MRKKRSSDREKLLKNVTRTVIRATYSNSERSEQFLAFLTLVHGDFSYLIICNNQNSNWKKILRFRNMQEKLENVFSLLLNTS